MSASPASISGSSGRAVLKTQPRALRLGWARNRGHRPARPKPGSQPRNDRSPPSPNQQHPKGSHPEEKRLHPKTGGTSGTFAQELPEDLSQGLRRERQPLQAGGGTAYLSRAQGARSQRAHIARCGHRDERGRLGGGGGVPLRHGG